MRINDARKLKVGQKVMTPRGFLITVKSLNEFTSAIGRQTIVYVKGTTEEGNIMKFGHKELKLVKE